MERRKHHIGRIAAAMLVCSLLGAACLTAAPMKASAAEGAEARNENLVVRYALDDTNTTEGQKLAATVWDPETKAFVANTSADATVQNHVDNAYRGTVAHVEGKAGGALSFTGKAHARANFHLPSDATGMTISLWVKNITTYWGSLIEFWNGSVGGRLGKGTMQGDAGRGNVKGEADPWNENCGAHKEATMEPGAGWSSFIIAGGVHSGDNGGAEVDTMTADTWYQVTFTVTDTEMKAYRNGALKQTFNSDVSKGVVRDIMTAAKDQTNGKVGIRLSHDTTESRADILDELRIYNGAMTEDEVRELYFEYNPAEELLYYIPDEVYMEGLGYPDILLGGATEVTNIGGKMTGTTDEAHGSVTYSYDPLPALATPAQDAKGVTLNLSRGELTATTTLVIRRNISPKLNTVSYTDKSGKQTFHAEGMGNDIVVKVPAGTDLSKSALNPIGTMKMFDEDGEDSHYGMRVSYDEQTHVYYVRLSYTPYEGCYSLYTVRFAEKSVETFTAMHVTSGANTYDFTPDDFKSGASSAVAVDSAENFSVSVKLDLAEGASATDGAEHIYTQAGADGKIAIAVTCENGDTVTYSLQPVVRSSDAQLSALSAGSYTLSPAFAAETTSYTVRAGKGEGVNVYKAIDFTAHDGKATAVKQYDASNHQIVVTVTAESGAQTRYVITVEEKDGDATLSSVTADGVLLAGFDPQTTEYTVKYKDALPEIAYTAASESAEVVKGDVEGNVMKLTVTAEDGTEKVYTLTFVRMSSDAEIKKLTVNGAEVALEDGAAAWTAPFGMRFENIAVEAEVAEGAHYAVTADEAEGKLHITVTAEDGTEREYTVTVTLSASPVFAEGTTEDNSPETGCGAALGGASAALLALAACLGAAVGKKRKH